MAVLEDFRRAAGSAARGIAGAIIPGQAGRRFVGALTDEPPAAQAAEPSQPSMSTPPFAPPVEAPVTAATGVIQRPAAGGTKRGPPIAAPSAGAPQPGGAMAVQDIDPEIGIKVARESAEAARNTSPEDKARVNESLEDTFGPGSVEQAYNDLLKRITAGRETRAEDEDEGKFSFKKMTKEDKGLFLMDFGMRLMAHSGQWNSQLGGAIGEAGIGALGGEMDRQAQAFERDEARRLGDLEQQRSDEDLALELTDMATGSVARGENILRTAQGYFDTTTGDFVRSPDGTVLQPHSYYGGGGAGGGRPSAKTEFANQLIRIGWPEQAAFSVAAGSRTPERVADDAARMWDQLEAKGDIKYYDVPGQGQVRARQATAEQKEAARRAFVMRSKNSYEGLLGSAGVDSEAGVLGGDYEIPGQGSLDGGGGEDWENDEDL